MAKYIILDARTPVDVIEGKSLKEISEGLPLGAHQIFSIQAERVVRVEEVVSTRVEVVKDDSWDTNEEE